MQKFLRARIAPAAIAVALLAGAPALADQAACNSEKDAAKALKLIKKSKAYRDFCKPCGDVDYVTHDIQTSEVEVTTCGAEVKINGTNVDLAYIYVYDKKKDEWVNVAMKVGIEVHDVPKTLGKDMEERASE
jgi:hypothetical protein